MVVAQFLETSYKVLSKLNSYHALACFPKDTVRDDIHRVMKYVQNILNSQIRTKM